WVMPALSFFLFIIVSIIMVGWLYKMVLFGNNFSFEPIIFLLPVCVLTGLVSFIFIKDFSPELKITKTELTVVYLFKENKIIKKSDVEAIKISGLISPNKDCYCNFIVVGKNGVGKILPISSKRLSNDYIKKIDFE
ncbi:MAG: hypothetical protein RSH78_06245, partial [Bacilli bacterium]